MKMTWVLLLKVDKVISVYFGFVFVVLLFIIKRFWHEELEMSILGVILFWGEVSNSIPFSYGECFSRVHYHYHD